jgi:hypothetical protein
MSLFSAFAQLKYYVKPPRWSGHSPDPENLIFGAGEIDPTVNANWKSPSVEVVSDLGEYLYLFDYTTNPGSVTYIGTQKILVECEAIVSTKTSVANTLARLQWAKNGANSGTRYTQDVIGGANTSAQLNGQRNFELETGDFLDFFFSVDKACTLTIDKAEWDVKAISTIWP